MFNKIAHQNNRVLKIFLLLILSFVYLENIEPQSKSKEKIINKIIYNGLKRAKKKDIDPLILSHEGTILDLMLVEEDYQRLIGLGSFEDVMISTENAVEEQSKKPIPDTINLIFSFQEKPVIRKIIFRGNKRVSYGMLIDSVTIKVGDFLDVIKIHSDITTITDKYKKKGFNHAVAAYEVFQDEALKEYNRVDLIFKVEEGVETYVQEIIFNGNTTISDVTLKNKIKTKERKYLGLQKGTFVESDFRQDIEDIKKYYRDLGYYLVDIPEPEVTYYEIVEKELKKEIIKIKVQIKENEQYTFAGITVTGNKVFSEKDLMFQFKIKEGQLFNYTKYQESIFAMQKIYTDHGYIQTQIDDNPIIDKVNKTIKVELKIVESKRSYIEAIYFKGNEKTKNYVLQRAVYTEVGEIFNSSKLMDSLIGLHNLGFFMNVNYDIQPGSASGLLKITYLLEETKTAEVRFGLSVSPGETWDISLFAEVNEKNFTGRELILGAKAEGSLFKQGLSLSITDPWFYNFPISLSANVKFYHNWTRQVYRQLTGDDYVGYRSNNGKDAENDTDVRNWYTAVYGGGDDDRNYLGFNKEGYFNRGIHDLTFENSINAGYRFFRYFTVAGGISCTPMYSWMHDIHELPEIYSSSIYYQIARGNGWSVKNKVYATFAIETTRRRVNPFSGVRWSFTTAYTFGHYDSLSLNTKFTSYLPILDVYFNEWEFKNVLVFNMGISMVLPGFRNTDKLNYFPLWGENTYGKGPIMSSSDYLSVDGIFSGRGWTNSLIGTSYLGYKTGYLKFDYTLEYRVPVYDKILWVAGFIDAVNLISGPTKLFRSNNGDWYYNTENSWAWWATENDTYFSQPYQPMGIDNWYFSIGAGLQITFPQLPLSFYVVKRFKINHYTGIEWQNNSVGGIDFVLSMVGVSF